MSSLKFRLKIVAETRNFLIEKTKDNDLMSEKHKKTCKYLNHVERLFILTSTVTGCVSDYALTSLVCFPVDITSSAVGLKIFGITAGIKKYKSIIKKKKKKHDEIVLLEKMKLDTSEVLIEVLKSLVDSYISHDEFVSVDNVLREYNEMKEELKNFVEYIL